MSTTITLTSTASVGFHHAIQGLTPMPNSYVLTFDIDHTDWMTVVRYLNSNSWWIIGCNGSGNPLVYVWDGASYTQVASSNETIVANSQVMVFFGEMRYGTTSDLWHVAALWCNGHLMVHYAIKVGVALNQDHFFGFAIRESLIRTFNNIHVPELTDMAEVCTIDPGENALGALQRTIEGRNIKYLIRWNGALKAYKPGPQGVVHDTSNDRYYSIESDFLTNSIKSHLRMIGAYDQAEFKDDSLAEKYGYRFVQQQNPFLMNQAQCLREAERALRRIQEYATQESVASSAMHFLEQEDRIITSKGDRLVSGLKVKYTPPMAQQVLDLRGYVYGE